VNFFFAEEILVGSDWKFRDSSQASKCLSKSNANYTGSLRIDRRMMTATSAHKLRAV